MSPFDFEVKFDLSSARLCVDNTAIDFAIQHKTHESVTRALNRASFLE